MSGGVEERPKPGLRDADEGEVEVRGCRGGVDGLPGSATSEYDRADISKISVQKSAEGDTRHTTDTYGWIVARDVCALESG